MQYTVQDAARLLKVSEETIYRFIREENFPAEQFNDRYHINQQRLIEWAHERHIPLVFSNAEGLPTLDSALEAGTLLRNVRGDSKREVLRSVIDGMPLPDGADRSFLFDMIWAREQLGSTGFGNGIAIPHARRPIMLGSDQSYLTVVYMEKPIDFSAVDGQPVSVLFLLVTPTIRVHLHLLARLGYALNDPQFLKLVQTRSDKDRLLQRLRELENTPKTAKSAS